MLIDPETIEDLPAMVDAGFALHWLHPKTKRPIGDDWSTKPVASVETLRRRHATGNNLGVRLGEVSKMAAGGYLHCLDVDIRDPALAAVAWAKLAELLPEVDLTAFPTVQSGSGGESRHVYFITDAPFASKKIAKSAGSKMVFDPAKGRDVKKHDWEIEVFGYPKQVVLPPSIHPDTGEPYIWLRPFDFDMLALGAGPFVPSAAIERVGGIDNSQENAEPSELKPKLGLTIPEAKAILAELPLEEWCEDRDGWLQTGMALHHEFGEDGYAIWTEFSKQSAKFDDKNQLAVWKSFRAKPNSVRMATLKGAAATARLQTMFDEVDDEEFDEFDALLGKPGSPVSAEMDDLDTIIAKAMAPASGTAKLDWRQLLQVNEEGTLKPTLHNLELIIRNDARFAGVAQFNLFVQEVVQRRPPGLGKRLKGREGPKGVKQLSGPIWTVRDTINGDMWGDTRDNSIRSIIEAPETQGGYGIKVSDRDLGAAVDLSARAHSFHPVREYLEELKWDRTPRLDTFLSRYLGAPDTAYTRNVARLTLLGGVVRVFEPGHKFDFVPILEGLQGKRKSTFIAILARHWFAELEGNFNDRKMLVEKMFGSWILELPELQGFNRAEVSDLKAFVSAQKDKVRLAYARRAEEFQRQCIFIGSTNEGEYLKDNTGGRRFWPIACSVGQIDTAAFEKEVDLLWAEAMHHYREMRREQPYGMLPLYLTDVEAHAEALGLQESRRIETEADVLAGQIGDWLDLPINEGFDQDTAPVYRQETCLIEIWVECFGAERRTYDRRAQLALGNAIKLVDGWEKARQAKTKYGKQRTYFRGGLRARVGLQAA